MTDTRPPQVGNYELMTDYESNEMTVRIFRMVAGVERVEPHVHQRSAQVYVPTSARSSSRSMVSRQR